MSLHVAKQTPRGPHKVGRLLPWAWHRQSACRILAPPRARDLSPNEPNDSSKISSNSRRTRFRGTGCRDQRASLGTSATKQFPILLLPVMLPHHICLLSSSSAADARASGECGCMFQVPWCISPTLDSQLPHSTEYPQTQRSSRFSRWGSC